MTNDPLDAMKARWNHIQGSLFPWLREEVDPITEALGRLVSTLDVIGLEAFVPEPPRGPGRPPEDRRACKFPRSAEAKFQPEQAGDQPWRDRCLHSWEADR